MGTVSLLLLLGGSAGGGAAAGRGNALRRQSPVAHGGSLLLRCARKSTNPRRSKDSTQHVAIAFGSKGS
jgi:hypothetical protein